jgi:hypothetical protein
MGAMQGPESTKRPYGALTSSEKRALVTESEFMKHRQTIRDADSAKSARLRALRLAKEAVDREAAAQKQAAEKPTDKRRLKPR